MIQACLIGAGRMGYDHARHIDRSADATLYCVVDTDRQAAEKVAAEFGIRAYCNVEEALGDPQVEAVAIATPTGTHAELIVAVASAKKPIFCEKPIALDRESIDHCLAVVAEHQVPFFVAFNRRFDPSFQSLQQRIRKGAVGPIEHITMHSRDWRLPAHHYLRTSGLLFRDMTIHDFDMARWLLQEEPVEVFATGSRLIDPTIAEFGDFDTATVVLKTARGAIVQIVNSRRSVAGYDQRIEVSGPKGILQANNLTPTTVVFNGEHGVTADAPYPSYPQRFAEGYQNEVDHFFTDVVRDGKPPLITGFDGRQALVIADAATQSCNEGKLVSIPPPLEATN